MSTNPPKAYGYIYNPPGHKPGDECDCWGEWKTREQAGHFSDVGSIETCHNRRRKIDPGPEHELVGEDEVKRWIASGDPMSTFWEVTTDGKYWFYPALGNADGAIGVRRKVVKEQWPKYWQLGERNVVSRQVSKDSLAEVWCIDGQWKYCPIVENDTPITPQRAFELTGDKSILEKGGDEKCHTSMTPMVASPAPGETKGALHPATLCCGYRAPFSMPYPVMWNELNLVVQCHNCGATYFPANKLAASPSSPAWIPVNECKLGPTDQLIYGRFDGDKQWKTSLIYERSHPMPNAWTHFVPVIIPPPPQPKTQKMLDEEWFAKWRADHCQFTYQEMLHATCAYARGEKVESK